MRLKLFIFLLWLLGSTGHAEAANKAVYGMDNREGSSDSKWLYQDIGRSTVAKFYNFQLVSFDSENYIYSGKTLEESGFCADVQFSNQTTQSQCSGFLVADDIIVTAGHCITDSEECLNTSWVFDYTDESDKNRLIPKKNAYRCKKVLAQNYFLKNDFAVIQLERVVTNRIPLKYRSNKALKKITDQMLLIGHPLGLPQKISFGGKIVSSDAKYIVTDLDAFGGNSGSAVVNQNSLLIEGILVSGAIDKYYDEDNKCLQLSKCDNFDSDNARCSGENVYRITNFPLKEIIKREKSPEPHFSFMQYCEKEVGDSSDQTFINAVSKKYKSMDCEFLYNKLSTIKRVHLKGLGISSLKPITEFSNIQKLYLDNNLIENLSPLSGLMQLEKLSVDGNKIKKDEINCPANFRVGEVLRSFCLFSANR